MQKHLNVKTFLVLLTTIMVWASAFPAIRFALQQYSVGHIIFLRFLTASLILILIAAWQRIGLPKREDLPVLMVLGLFGFTIYNIALVNGEKTVLSGAASLIIACSPILTSIMAVVFWKEKLRWLGWLGSGLGLLGVALIAFRDLKSFQLEPGVFVIFLAAFCISFYSVFQKRLHQTYSVLQITVYTVLFGTLFLLVYALGTLQAIKNAPVSATLSLIYLGVFPTVLGFLGWNYALSRVSASIASSFQYLTPVFAALIAWSWLGEIPSGLTFAGGILTVLGVVIVNLWGKKRQAMSSSRM